MRIQHEEGNLVIRFVTEDFLNGKAEYCRNYMKTFPKGSRRYFQPMKKWIVVKHLVGPEVIEKLFAISQMEFDNDNKASE